MTNISKSNEPVVQEVSPPTGEDESEQINSEPPARGGTHIKVPSAPEYENNPAENEQKPYRWREFILKYLPHVFSILALGVSVSSRNASWESVGNSKRSADAAEKSAAAAQRSADVVEQSALGYLSLLDIHFDTFRPDEPIALIIIWKNDGNSPVTMNESIAKVGVVSYLPPANLCEGKASAPMSPIIIQPHNTRVQLISIGAKDVPSDQVQATIDGKAYFMVCGTVAYQTAGKNFSFPLCSYVKGSGSPFMECGTGRKK